MERMSPNPLPPAPQNVNAFSVSNPPSGTLGVAVTIESIPQGTVGITLMNAYPPPRLEIQGCISKAEQGLLGMDLMSCFAKSISGINLMGLPPFHENLVTYSLSKSKFLDDSRVRPLLFGRAKKKTTSPAPFPFP